MLPNNYINVRHIHIKNILVTALFYIHFAKFIEAKSLLQNFIMHRSSSSFVNQRNGIHFKPYPFNERE